MQARRSTRKSARALGLVLTFILIAGLFLSAAPPQRVQAGSGIVFDGTPGTAAPPATLGPYTMIPFPADGRPLGDDVTTVPGPTGDVIFSEPMHHLTVSTYGCPWNSGYTGDLYLAYSSQVTMTLPPDTFAFYFYALGPHPGCYHFRVTTQDSTTSGVVEVCADVGVLGPKYFGFYSTGASIERITVTCLEMPEDLAFALGQFGISRGTPPASPRADVSVKIYGGWDGIPVNAYVGGTEQETLYTAHDAFGEAAVLWTFYPSASGWEVSVAPELPAGLDAERWQYKLVRIVADGSDVEDPTAASATIYPCTERVFYFQLIDTGALPPEE